jgi:putative oxygen-independent coproporphyrinogen III oxidase
MNPSLKPSSTFSLYVHLPWCKAKCPYCDFNSHAAEHIPAERYARALIADLDRELPRIWGRRLHSIFIGGGTPSLFPPEIINQLLSDIRARLQPLSAMEVTLEANPGAIEAAAFADFRAAGVTRLSLGIQSFNNVHLQRLGRIHDASAAHRAVEKAIAAQFASFNLDLMFALPGQSTAEALADLNAALQYQPPHLSLYQLTLEVGTPLPAILRPISLTMILRRIWKIFYAVNWTITVWVATKSPRMPAPDSNVSTTAITGYMGTIWELAPELMAKSPRRKASGVAANPADPRVT